MLTLRHFDATFCCHFYTSWGTTQKWFNISLFFLLKNLKSKIYPFINFLSKYFLLLIPLKSNCYEIFSDSLALLSSLLNNLFKMCSPRHVFLVFVLASLWHGHVFFPVPQNLTIAICSSWLQNLCCYLYKII